MFFESLKNVQIQYFCQKTSFDHEKMFLNRIGSNSKIFSIFYRKVNVDDGGEGQTMVIDAHQELPLNGEQNGRVLLKTASLDQTPEL